MNFSERSCRRGPDTVRASGRGLRQRRCSSDAAAPAHVENAVPESALATITLTAEAAARLGIETVAVERRSVTLTRLLGGELSFRRVTR